MYRIRAFILLTVLVLGIASRLAIGLSFAHSAQMHISDQPNKSTLVAATSNGDQEEITSVRIIKANRILGLDYIPKSMVFVNFTFTLVEQSLKITSSPPIIPLSFTPSPSSRPPAFV